MKYIIRSYSLCLYIAYVFPKADQWLDLKLKTHIETERLDTLYQNLWGYSFQVGIFKTSSGNADDHQVWEGLP